MKTKKNEYWESPANEDTRFDSSLWRHQRAHHVIQASVILNAFYKYKSETEGEPPMSIEVFKERKKIINVLSKS